MLFVFQVIRRVVKNAKTGEIIKTDIVRVNENGEETILSSHAAGTSAPSLTALQGLSVRIINFYNKEKKNIKLNI